MGLDTAFTAAFIPQIHFHRTSPSLDHSSRRLDAVSEGLQKKKHRKLTRSWMGALSFTLSPFGRRI